MSAQTPYPYQERVASLLLDGHSAILQAPTGAGKTRAALLPFLHARQHLTPEHFPRKCIYSVPMRVLANQFVEEYRKVIREYGWQHKLDVSIQTGAVADDPKLEGDLIFTTIDQTLSNFLNIPYALGLGQANLNAGAVLSSYLVFDELHLFDPETALPTTLHMLKLVRGVVPFLVMTATFSTERVRALAHELNAEPVVLSAEEAAAIPSQHKTRRTHTIEDVLTAEAVLARHQQRSIAICNTVARAQDLFDALVRTAGPAVEIRLLHSHFLRKDRDASEAWLRREFGKDRKAHTVASAILVATQVAEVGLDISSEALHTDLAPAASVLQRAGRCARYPSEEGDVFVYRLPVDDQGKMSYAPYLEGGQPAICDLTWEALGERQGVVCDFGRELAIVDYAHHAADQRLLKELSAKRGYFAQKIEQAIISQDRSAARELIRDVDSRMVIVHPEPRTIENPWVYEGFSIFRGSLLGAYADLEQVADQIGADWVMMTAEPQPEEEQNQRAKTVWVWRYIKDKKDLVSALLVAVNPALACYSEKLGFRLGMADGLGEWQSPLATRYKAPQYFAPYRRETIAEHVARIVRVCSQPYFAPVTGQERQPLFAELAHASRRLEQKQGWPAGMLERLSRLVIVAHDLGKLDVRWQRWAHRWQEEVSKLRGQDLRIPEDYMVAHTDYNEQDPAEKALSLKLRGMKPNHAAESAGVAMNWLRSAASDQALARAALTAIIAHHSAGAKGDHDTFQAHPAAPMAFKQMVAGAGLAEQAAQEPVWRLAKGEGLINRKIRPDREEELLAYLLIVRALRLGDQRSQST